MYNDIKKIVRSFENLRDSIRTHFAGQENKVFFNEAMKDVERTEGIVSMVIDDCFRLRGDGE
jgi:hypothetical protein